MISCLKNMSCRQRARGHVVDGALVLSFPHAVSPVVWRWDLAQAKAAAFEVLQNNQGQSVLSLKTTDDQKHNIAVFQNNHEAIEALMAASRALEKSPGGHGGTPAANDAGTTGTKPLASASAFDSSSEAVKWVIAIAGVLAVLGLFYYLTSVTPRTITGLTSAAATATATNDGEPANDAAGVPLSADAFLKGQ